MFLTRVFLVSFDDVSLTRHKVYKR